MRVFLVHEKVILIMKKLLLILLVLFGCSSNENDSNNSTNLTVMEELQASTLWHLDYSEYIDEITYYTFIDEFMRFNNTSSILELFEAWTLRFPNVGNLNCYYRVLSRMVTMLSFILNEFL